MLRELEGPPDPVGGGISSLIGAEITLPYNAAGAKEFIDSAGGAKVTIESIQKAVASQFGLRLVEIKAKNNHDRFVYPTGRLRLYLATASHGSFAA